MKRYAACNEPNCSKSTAFGGYSNENENKTEDLSEKGHLFRRK